MVEVLISYCWRFLSLVLGSDRCGRSVATDYGSVFYHPVYRGFLSSLRSVITSSVEERDPKIVARLIRSMILTCFKGVVEHSPLRDRVLFRGP